MVFKLLLLFFTLSLTINDFNYSVVDACPTNKVEGIEDCTWENISLHGKVQFVESFPDIKIQIVESFPDLKVKYVSAFPDHCGEWQVVESFPDFKVQLVESFPDIKIKIVDSFPGIN